MKQIVIIDYGSGNLRSVAKAFERVASAKYKVVVTSDPDHIADASHIVLPGVGAFADCMSGLQKTRGMIEAMEKQVLHNYKPFLGICVGMQMLFETGFEHGEHKGLGWLKGEVVKISGGRQANGVQSGAACPPELPLKIPHMGWNDLTIKSPHPLLENIHSGVHAYFVHSYHVKCKALSDVIATTDYGTDITAIVAKDNVMGTQFHPEKSQKTGLKLIENFLKM